MALSVDTANCDGVKTFLGECEIGFDEVRGYLVAAFMILEVAKV